MGEPFFSHSEVVSLELELASEAVVALRGDPDEYVHGAITVTLSNATTVHLGDIGVRLKGRKGSARTLDQKAAFLLKPNEYVKGQRLFGMTKLALNNMVQDTSMIHEQLSYELFRAMGVAAPRSGYARVTLNGELMGLYATIEVADNASFLEHWFGSEDGNLYEGEYGVDIEGNLVYGFDQDRGDDVGFADLAQLSAALDTMNDPATFLTEVASVVDIDSYIRFAATELFISHWDGYAGMRNNYFVYGLPGRPWTWMPWGTDQTFVGPGDGVWGGEGRVQRMCEASLACRERLSETYGELVGLMAELDLAARVDDLETLIADAVAEDPRKEYTTEEVLAAIDAVRNYLAERPATIEGELACTDPTAVDRDGDGVTGCGLDCNDSDPAVHPGVAESCNLVDDDCSGIVDDAPEGCPPCGFREDDAGQRYGFCFRPLDYLAAQASCEDQAGHLVAIHSQAQQEWLSATALTLDLGTDWWIGLSDRSEEGTFTWEDASEVAFTHWHTGEPNNWADNEDCANMTAESTWNDLPCGTVLNYICQLP